MENEINSPHEKLCVKVPDEIWQQLFASRGKGIGMFSVSVRLLNGEVFTDLLISNRGYIVGREAPGLAGAHGDIDNSMLTFKTEEIEGIMLRLRYFIFWKSRWICLNPRHPARRQYQKIHG
jgi:hypothetical protein